MGDLERRLERLEAVHAAGAASEAAGENDSYRDFFEMETSWIALDLLRGREPYFTLREDGSFRTQDGRFAVSPNRLDIRGLFRKDPTAEEWAISAERWERLIEEDERAAEALERLGELAEDALVPVDYRMPNSRGHDQGEINDRIGNFELGSVFVDADERERVRRLTYVLTHVPDARAALCFVTKRRDAFVDAEGHEVPF
jgi:CheY-like chemotaxis protein